MEGFRKDGRLDFEAKALALSDFYSFQNKKLIFRQFVLNHCKLLWRAFKACVVRCCLY